MPGSSALNVYNQISIVHKTERSINTEHSKQPLNKSGSHLVLVDII